MVAGKQVNIKEKGKDRYGRTIGVVYYKNEDINEQMVLKGFAWAFLKYSKEYVKQEQIARDNKNGLWKDKNAIAPWEFRKIE